MPGGGTDHLSWITARRGGATGRVHGGRNGAGYGRGADVRDRALTETELRTLNAASVAR